MKSDEKIITINSLDELSKVAEIIKQMIASDKVFAFYGSMGAGKTTIIKEICKHLNVIDTVTSPTFALINEYKTTNSESIFHFDFYRINKISEVFDMGYEEYFFSGKVCLIEWPELIEELLPEKYIKITIEVKTDNTRTIKII